MAQAICREIALSDRGGQRGADHKHDTEPLEHIAEAPGERRDEHAHGRASAQHEPWLRRWQPVRAEHGREKGRRDSEARVQRSIQEDEWGQHGRPDSLIHGVQFS